MESPVTCIVLRTIKYSDSASIATLWSREYGRMAVSISSGSGRAAQRFRALMMPLSTIAGIADIRPGREISRIKDVRPIGAGMLSNPGAMAIAIFLADFLYAALKDSGPDPVMTDYLLERIEALKKAKGNALANFHLHFLYKMSVFLGISPDMGTYAEGRYFDMREARYSATAPLHSHALDPARGRALYVLSRLSDRSLGLMRLSRAQRNEMLDLMLDYYCLHYAKLNALPSLSVVRELFSPHSPI